MRHSKQRDLVLKVLRENFTHPTAKQVLQLAQMESPEIGIATVYRNLNQLAEMGFIQKISMPDDIDRFDGNMSLHHHVICRKCGAVYDSEFQLDQELEKTLEEQYGMIACDCQISISGVCIQCRKKS